MLIIRIQCLDITCNCCGLNVLASSCISGDTFIQSIEKFSYCSNGGAISILLLTPRIKVLYRICRLQFTDEIFSVSVVCLFFSTGCCVDEHCVGMTTISVCTIAEKTGCIA